jgi:hypothetical protein
LPRTTQNPRLNELAKRGAEVRLRELAYEVKSLIGLFPHLRNSLGKDKLPHSVIAPEGSGATKKEAGRRKRPKMSAAARKAVSERMKKYWAARRKADKG